jgi:hypothetical protein
VSPGTPNPETTPTGSTGAGATVPGVTWRVDGRLLRGAGALDALSPRHLGDPESDELVAEIVEVGEEFEKRARTMNEALKVLFREGILEEQTIRAMRKQRELDGKRLIERYKTLLSRYKFRAARATADASASGAGTCIADALIIKIDFIERAYLHQKQLLMISTEIEGMQEEIRHLERVCESYRGSRVAYSAEEKLTELRRREAELLEEKRFTDLERQVMEGETALLVTETLRSCWRGEEKAEAEREIKQLETRLGRLIAELAQLPRREGTRRRSRRTGPPPLV